MGMAKYVIAQQNDIRKLIPFEADRSDACYSHMLFYMALTTPELEAIFGEVCQVLSPAGLVKYIYGATHKRPKLWYWDSSRRRYV